MKKIEVKELKDNMFETISKEWMLVTAGTKDKFNTMTANWGGIVFKNDEVATLRAHCDLWRGASIDTTNVTYAWEIGRASCRERV